MDQSDNRFYREAAPVDGGPAFPCHTNPRPGTLSDAPQGMTLRDYFAAHAPIDQEISLAYAQKIVGRDCPDYAGATIANAMFWAEFRARMRYIEADAMLRARGEPCA